MIRQEGLSGKKDAFGHLGGTILGMELVRDSLEDLLEELNVKALP